MNADSPSGYGEKIMMMKDKATRDTFALSLGGVTAVTGFFAMPAIATNRLRKDPARTASKPRSLNWRVWTPRRVRVV
jgi:hypothetical protein